MTASDAVTARSGGPTLGSPAAPQSSNASSMTILTREVGMIFVGTGSFLLPRSLLTVERVDASSTPSAERIYLWPPPGFATASSPRLGRLLRCLRAPVTRQATRRTDESEPPSRRLPQGMSPNVWRSGRAHWTANST